MEVELCHHWEDEAKNRTSTWESVRERRDVRERGKEDFYTFTVLFCTLGKVSLLYTQIVIK